MCHADLERAVLEVEAAIVVLDPGDAVPLLLVPTLALVFEDAVEPGFLLARPDHLQAVAHFLATSPKRIAVSCTYGVSRSPALAAFVLHLQHSHLKDAEVVTGVRELAPGAAPNEHVLRLVDACTGRKLCRAFRRY